MFTFANNRSKPREGYRHHSLRGTISAMTGTRLLFAQVFVLAILFPLVLSGISHDYLWGVAWFSATAHFLGGLWVALCAAWGQSMLGLPRDFVLLIAAALAIGIGWEVFEGVIGATHFPADTVDTVEDLVMDIVGGTAGALMMRYIWQRK